MKIKTFVARKWKLLTFITLILIGVLFFVFRNRNKEVETGIIQKGKISQELFLSGEVMAKNHAKLSFETSGKIVYVGVKEGDSVNKGRLISKLDTTVLNSSYQTALANLRLYEATVQNVHDQVKGHSGDETFAQKDSRTTAEVNKDKAYEAVVAAKRNLDGASLFAPFAGIVTYLAHPFSGVYTTTTATEAEIVDPQTIYFEVLADQNEVINIHTNQNVEVVLDSFEDKEFEGIVEYISFAPQASEASTTYKIVVKFEGLDFSKSGFKLGMTGDAKFILKEKSDAFFVPSNFVKSDKNGKYLKLDASGRKRLSVETGLESEENIEVIGNFSEGQVVYD